MHLRMPLQLIEARKFPTIGHIRYFNSPFHPNNWQWITGLFLQLKKPYYGRFGSEENILLYWYWHDPSPTPAAILTLILITPLQKCKKLLCSPTGLQSCESVTRLMSRDRNQPQPSATLKMRHKQSTIKHPMIWGKKIVLTITVEKWCFPI